MVMAVKNECAQANLQVPITRVCRLLEVPRSTVYYQPRQRQKPRINCFLEQHIKEIIEQFPTFGIRRVWAWIRYRQGMMVNRKAVARIMTGRSKNDEKEGAQERYPDRWRRHRICAGQPMSLQSFAESGMAGAASCPSSIAVHVGCWVEN